METILHLFGLCPDHLCHVNALDALAQCGIDAIRQSIGLAWRLLASMVRRIA